MQTHSCLIIYLNIQQHFSTYLPYPFSHTLVSLTLSLSFTQKTRTGKITAADTSLTWVQIKNSLKADLIAENPATWLLEFFFSFMVLWLGRVWRHK